MHVAQFKCEGHEMHYVDWAFMIVDFRLYSSNYDAVIQ